MTSSDTTRALQQSACVPQPEASPKPFPFFSLPAEILLMIYEEYVTSLTITTKQHEIRTSDLDTNTTPGLEEFWPTKELGPQFICLNRLSISMDLLYTSRLIHNEAATLFAPLLRELATKPLHFDASPAGANALTVAPSPLVACIDRDTCYMGILTRAVEDFINLCRRPLASYTLGPVNIVINVNGYVKLARRMSCPE